MKIYAIIMSVRITSPDGKRYATLEWKEDRPYAPTHAWEIPDPEVTFLLGEKVTITIEKAVVDE